MGSVWLGSMPEVLREAGLWVSTWPGWETRSRSSGGYDAVWAIGVHHDAGTTGTSLESRCSYAWERSPDRPIGALWLHTDGHVMVGAAGATNTQGKGGPLWTSKGTIPLDQGNRYMLSIEASNNGVGEHWPTVQQDAYVLLCATLCQWLGLDPIIDVIAHFEYTNRKIDPAGDSRYASGGASWNMTKFRSDVSVYAPKPIPVPPSTDEEIDMLGLDFGTPGKDSWWTRLTYTGDTLCHVVSPADALQARGKVPITSISETELNALLDSVMTIGPSPFGPGQAPNSALNTKWEQARGRT